MRSYAEITRWLASRKSGVQLYRSQMHDYQKIAYDFVMATPFCALFIDLGMGKTVTAGTVACDLLTKGQAKKVLIIAPLRVANKTWPDELDQWDQLAYWPYAVITGDADRRKRELRSNTRIHIVNRESVEWLVEYWQKDWPYDVVIIDESSAFKDHTTKRFKALRKVRKYMKRMVQLTATPAAETYLHLFAQIHLLDGGERLGKNITGFKREYFDVNRWTYKCTIKPGAAEEIERKISDIVLVMRAEDYLDLEVPVRIRNTAKLTNELFEKYYDLARESVLDLDDAQIVAENAAALSGKLHQFASGFVYENRIDEVSEDVFEESRVTHHLHDLKMELLEQIVEEAQGEQVLVVYHFKPSLERLLKRFKNSKAMDKAGALVTEWNNKKVPMLLVHPQSAGHGLNLQRGGRRIVFFDLPWSLELYQQVIGRLARQGQLRQVFVHHLMIENTLDETVYDALQAKEDVQESLFRALIKLHKEAQSRGLKRG